jgi:hypothetical protein
MVELPLETLQKWMQAVIVHPGTEDEALASEAASRLLPPEQLPEVILPSQHLTPAERLGIYQGMYPLRMEEALASDYPGLKHYLGDHAFYHLVVDYVQSHPSRNFSLNRLGDQFVAFVGEHLRIKQRGFCHDLARLEFAAAMVFDEEETAPLSADEIAAVPADAWETAALTPVKAFRLLALRYPASAWLDTLHDEKHDHPQVRRKDTWVAVYRRDYRVVRHDLTEPAHDLLADLAAGQPLGQALGAALSRGGRRAPSEDLLFRWFREWIQGGVFRAIRLV